MSTRARGAHRLRPVVAGGDPREESDPRRWVVSLGVLGVVAAICVAGVVLLGGGRGDGGEAAVRQAAGAPAPSPVPSRWSAVMRQPSDEQAVGAQPGAAGAADSGSSAGTESGSGAVDGSGSGSGPGSGAGGGPTSGSGAPSKFGAGTVSGFTEQSASVGAAGSATQAGASGGSVTAAGRATAASAVRVPIRRTGTGRLVVVHGNVRAPRAAASMRVQVQVEQGTGVDGQAFARFVMATLNDPKGWGHDDNLSFARTDGPADFRVILAGAATARRRCSSHADDPPSCGGGDQAVLDLTQWLDGVPAYGGDLVGFRHYAINHEVGHVLGHANGFCDPGHLAPVMVQQSLGLHGCLRNAWPYPNN